MFSDEDKALITQTDPGTLDEEFALYRDEEGAERSAERPRDLASEPASGDGPPEEQQAQRIGFRCPQRGAVLTSGRLKFGGLRCIYHGWGHCLEQLDEPHGSTF